MNVAEAAPGDPDYNGGRWMVHGVSFANYVAAVAAFDADGSGNFDSAEEVEAAIAAGAATDLGVVKRFTCPAILCAGADSSRRGRVQGGPGDFRSASAIEPSAG